MTTVALNHLWTYIESLGLNSSNRKWLVEKLIEPTKEVPKEPAVSNTLRNAFSGDWAEDMDSTTYAQILRDECVLSLGGSI